MLQSNGTLTSPEVTWAGSVTEWSALQYGGTWSSYSELYRAQLWVAICVNKLTGAAARLPLKVYERAEDGRLDARDSAYGALLARPNRRMNTADLVTWAYASYLIYGEALLVKVRDGGGRPVELYPVPSHTFTVKMVDGRAKYRIGNGAGVIEGIDEEDVVHWKRYNPSDSLRGLSVLEPLRATLEAEDAARRSTAAFWRNGARPSIALKHPGKLSEAAAGRLRVQWDSVATGVHNTGATVILEEGLTPEILTVNAADAQYIETRKLNREEVVAAFDIPQAAVGILEHATYNNVTEMMRSLYRDTMAPLLSSFENTLQMQLRGGLRRASNGPDFGDAYYAEFLLDDVLRGDWESRTTSYQMGITSGWLTPAEVRKMENLPPVEGADRLYIQGAMVPLPTGDEGPDGIALAERIGTAVQRLGLGVNYNVITPDEARQIIGIRGDLPEPATPAPAVDAVEAAPKSVDAAELRTVMGRLSRQKTLADVDLPALLNGLDPLTQDRVVKAYVATINRGEGIAEFRTAIKAERGTR